MKENNNLQEIDLKEIIMILWKRKIVIITYTMVFAILAGVISMFLIPPAYKTKLNIIVSMPEIYHTRYGEYKLPISTNEQYINLITSNDVLKKTLEDMDYKDDVTLNSIIKRISISKTENKAGTTQNSFEVTVTADNPEESLKLAQTVYSNFLDFLDAMTKERAVNYYYNEFNVELKSLGNSLKSEKEILTRNEELLTEFSKFINEGKADIEIHTQLDSTSDYVIPVNTLNPNYIKIENDIVANKQNINKMENEIMMLNNYLEELEKEKQAIYRYYRTGESEKLEASVIGVVETYIYLPSPPALPTQNSNPNTIIFIAIGAVIGGVIGVLYSLIYEYWYKNTL